MANLSEVRQRFVSTTQSKIVSPDEFLGMMISRVSLTRADEPQARMLGLIDEETGNRILVKVEELNRMSSMNLQLN